MERTNNPKQNACCSGCIMWNNHQHKCWYYWEYKKACTQFLGEQQPPINK